MRHEIKIEQPYLIHILEGKKTFEVRKNDRDYQVGDTIWFMPIESYHYNAYEVKSPLQEYEIIYIHEGLGLQEGYAVLSIREKTNETEN